MMVEDLLLYFLFIGLKIQDIFAPKFKTFFFVKQVFRLTLTTQAGTYVKEFVHGDLGRTTPNLREILNIPDLDIIALDVMVTYFFLVSENLKLGITTSLNRSTTLLPCKRPVLFNTLQHEANGHSKVAKIIWDCTFK